MIHPSTSSPTRRRRSAGATLSIQRGDTSRMTRRGLVLALACCALLSVLAACGTSTTRATGTATATPTTPAAATATANGQAPLSIYVLVITANGSANTVYALNPADGTPRWTRQLPNSSSLMLAAADGTIYIVGQYGAITALRAQDGSQLWSITGHLGLYIQPVADGGMLFVSAQGSSTTHGYLDAYRASDGSRVWEHDEGFNTGASLGASGGVLYANGGASLSALRESDGGTLWQQSVTAPSVQPLVIGGAVYLNNSGEVFAFDAASGAPQWHYKPPTLASPSDETVSGCAGLIFAGNSLNLNALRAADGSLVWSNAYHYLFFGTSCSNGTVYVSLEPGTLRALNATTGAQMWSATLLGNSGDAPILSGGTLYESRSDAETAQPNGYVYALNPTTGAVIWKFAQSDAGFTQIIVM